MAPDVAETVLLSVYRRVVHLFSDEDLREETRYVRVVEVSLFQWRPVPVCSFVSADGCWLFVGVG